MNKEQRKRFLREVDLVNEKFEIKIADFGFSKKLESRKDMKTYTKCGTPTFLSPEVVVGRGHSF